MHKNDAERILNATLSLSEAIGKIDDIISSMPDDSEKKVWVKRLGGLIGYLFEEIQQPIVREFPDLDPDKGRFVR